jgi:hypothetical protein
MSASKSRKARAVAPPEPTARPKPIAEGARWARDEFGMSVDSDDVELSEDERRLAFVEAFDDDAGWRAAARTGRTL